MTFLNNDANVKQFQLIKYVNENCSDDYAISKITIVLRRDKIEAPYYMDTNIKFSSCIDKPETGVIHAMDMLNHNRRYNLSEEKYNEIESLITSISGDESDLVKISKTDEKVKMDLISRNKDENKSLFEKYNELFEKIDNLID